jgi:hypothetical protein
MALAAARGRFIAFMDGDDLAVPERLAAQVTFLQRNPDIGVVGTWTQLIERSGTLADAPPLCPPSEDSSIRLEMLDDSGFLCATLLCRREALEGLRFREDLPYAEDYELTMRLIFRTSVANLPCCLYQYRQHETSATARLDESAKRAVREQIRADAVGTMKHCLRHSGSRGSVAGSGDMGVYDEALIRRTAYAWSLRAAATGRFQLSGMLIALTFSAGSSPRGISLVKGLRAVLAVHRGMGVGRSLAAVTRRGPRWLIKAVQTVFPKRRLEEAAPEMGVTVSCPPEGVGGAHRGD